MHRVMRSLLAFCLFVGRPLSLSVPVLARMGDQSTLPDQNLGSSQAICNLKISRWPPAEPEGGNASDELLTDWNHPICRCETCSPQTTQELALSGAPLCDKDT